MVNAAKVVKLGRDRRNKMVNAVKVVSLCR